MKFSKVLQLKVPDPFPLAEFEEFWNSAREVIPYPSETRREFNGASNLIYKETNRIKALQQELLKFNTTLKVNNDGSLMLETSSKFSHNTEIINPWNDHRMAMSVAPLALLKEIQINNEKVVSKS